MDKELEKQKAIEIKLNQANKEIERLTELNRKYDLLLGQIDDFIWQMDSNFDITYISPSVKIVLGFTEEEMLGKLFLKHMPTDSIALFNDAVKERREFRANSHEKTWFFDIITKKGELVHLETITSPVFNEKGVFNGLVAVSRNVTERNLINQKILEHDANLTAQFNNTTDSIWSIDMDYKIKTINQHFKTQFKDDYGVELTIGSPLLEYLPHNIKTEWKKRYDRALSGEQFIITDKFHFVDDPQYVEIRFNPISVNNTIVGVAVFSRDITQGKQYEKMLLESEANHRALIENTEARIWSIDTNYNIIAVNTNFANDYKTAFNFSLTKGAYAIENAPPEIEKRWKDRYNRCLQGERFSVVDEFNYKGVPNYTKTSLVPINVEGKTIGVSCLSQDITQQKLQETTLRESEQRFKFLSQASIDLLKLQSQDEILNYIAQTLQEKLTNTIVIALTINKQQRSATYSHIAGLTQSEIATIEKLTGFALIGAQFELVDQRLNVLSTDKLSKLKNGFVELVQNNISLQTAHEIADRFHANHAYVIGIKQNSTLYAALQFITINNATIEDTSFIESFVNLISLVLHQKILLKSLHFSEEKFRKIIDNTNSIISIQTNDRFLLLNNAWERITGYTIEEGLQMIPTKIIHPQLRDQIEEITIKRLREEEAPSNYLLRAIHKNENDVWIEVSTAIMHYEGEKAILLIGNDVTERKDKELKLNQLSAGIINTPMSIVITDIDGIIEYVNPYFCELTGYTAAEVIGKNPRILESGNTPREVYNKLWSSILKGEIWVGEFENKKKNGEHYWESARIAPIFDDEGIITSFISIKEDITERKNTLKQLENSEKKLKETNAQKDKFFSIIAHDLRSPFSGLVGIASLLKENFKQLDQIQIEKYLELINYTSQNTLKLLEDLLIWAQTQTGRVEFNPEVVSLKEHINQAIQIQQIAAKSKNIRIWDHTTNDVFLTADSNMLLTLLRNIISNAIKFTPKDGLVEISAETKHYNQKPFIVVAVKDTGVGIPEEKMNQLFKIEENYTTTGTEKEKGSGLGLILCKEFVEMHGGKIWCTSSVGKGSTFYFSLPG